MKQPLKPVAFAIVSLFLASASGSASADIIFSHTWTGNEVLQGPNRILRDGNASVAGTQKVFPGTLANNPTYFATLEFSATPGTTILVTPTTEDPFSFLALYGNPFTPANLATNYLGDQGGSGVGAFFSITAPASGDIFLVANTVNGSAAIGTTVVADITFLSAPEPGALTLVSMAAAILGVGAWWRRKRIAA